MLRFLDLLLHVPDRIPLSKLTKQNEDHDLFFQIPQPAHYLIHKYITLHRRTKIEAKQKDAFYIFDFLVRFEKSWQILIRQMQDLIQSGDFKCRQVKDFVRSFRAFFSSETSEGVMLLMEEYNRSYAGKYKLTARQAFDQVDRFILILNGVKN